MENIMRDLTGDEIALVSGGANQDSPDIRAGDIVVAARTRGSFSDAGFWCGYFGAAGLSALVGGCAGSNDGSVAVGVGFGKVQFEHVNEREIPRVSIGPEHIIFNLRSSDFIDAFNRGRDAANEISKYYWNELTNGRLSY